jgi:uncharacterized protein YrrD
MYKVNDLYGKKVINQATGEGVASVSDVVLSDDAQHIVALVAGGGTFSSDEQIIPWDRIVSIGDYVIAQSIEPMMDSGLHPEISSLREQAQRITGKTVISGSGERIGTVGDMFFAPNGTITGYEIKQGGMFGGKDTPILPARDIHSIGKDAIIAERGELVDREAFDAQWNTPADRAVGAPPLRAPDMHSSRQAGDLPPPPHDEPRRVR